MQYSIANIARVAHSQDAAQSCSYLSWICGSTRLHLACVTQKSHIKICTEALSCNPKKLVRHDSLHAVLWGCWHIRFLNICSGCDFQPLAHRLAWEQSWQLWNDLLSHSFPNFTAAMLRTSTGPSLNSQMWLLGHYFITFSVFIIQLAWWMKNTCLLLSQTRCYEGAAIRMICSHL